MIRALSTESCLVILVASKQGSAERSPWSPWGSIWFGVGSPIRRYLMIILSIRHSMFLVLEFLKSPESKTGKSLLRKIEFTGCHLVLPFFASSRFDWLWKLFASHCEEGLVLLALSSESEEEPQRILLWLFQSAHMGAEACPQAQRPCQIKSLFGDHSVLNAHSASGCALPQAFGGAIKDEARCSCRYHVRLRSRV